MKKLNIALMTLLLTTTTACRPGKKTEQLDRVVWSNDGVEQAFVMTQFEEGRSGNPLDGTTMKRNFSHQIFVQDPDGLNRRAVSNQVVGQNGGDLFYMRSAGYIVASFLQQNGENQAPYPRYYQLLMDGTTRTLTTAPHTRAVPSPDGKWIARVELNPEGCRPDATDNESESCRVQVEFLDAQTLMRHGQKHQVLFQNPSKVPDFTWTPEQEWVVTNRVQAFAASPDQEPEAADVPACLFPKTSSDHINADGSLIFPNGNTIDSRPATADDPQWGCQTP